MKKLGRLLLCLLGGVALLVCILLIGVNLYVQSQGTHHRIQQELSQRLNTPLQLRQISVTPWSGLKLSGITIPQEGRLGGNFLQAESFQLRIQFWSLFSDRLVIRQVSLVKPDVVWAQNSSGKWRLPELAPEDQVQLPPMAPAASTAPAGSPPPTSPPASVVPSAADESALAETPAPVFVPEVERVKLKDGNFTFLDSKGKLIAKFTGLDFKSSFRAARMITGNASVERISLRDRFFIDDLTSPLYYDPAELAFSNITAHAAGGAVDGQFKMQLQANDSPFTASVKFHDLQAEKLMVNAGGPAGIIQGRVDGFLEASGKTADSNALEGHGRVILRDGVVQQYSLLVALGQILQIDELMQLQLEQAEVKYHISPGIVTIDELLLRSPNIRLTATGTVTFRGKLRLDSQLALTDKIRRQLFAPIRANFRSLPDSPGYAAVDFKVSGTVDRPKTDLMDKLVGRDLRDLGSVISSLFGQPKKKPQEEVVPSPTPAASLDGSTPTNDSRSSSSASALTPRETPDASLVTPAPSP